MRALDYIDPDPDAQPKPHPADPKQGAGDAKVPFATLPFAVLTELAVAHGEGALKYGRHNWRYGEVLASTYYAAALRHLVAWIEGEDTDPDSGLSHLVKAMASLGVLRDAMLHGTMQDDRPPSLGGALMSTCNSATQEMRARVARGKVQP
ncbi:MAG: dATP/dGTP diphosphohydrolase domain-containing protein [Pseudomonadota bacterium]